MRNAALFIFVILWFQWSFLSIAHSNDNGEKQVRTISFYELNTINSEAFIKILKESSLVYIVKDVANPKTNDTFIIKNWPRIEDVPYLISIADSKEPCGLIWSHSFSVDPDWGSSNQPTVGDIAVQLLDVIRLGEFRVGFTYVAPEGREEVIEWARRQTQPIESAKP